MPPMPGPTADPLGPYKIFVTAVNNSSGNPVSGASFKLENITKSATATEVNRTSNESNSNIVIHVADCGIWENNDELRLTTTYDTEEKIETKNINTTTDPMGLEFGTIALSSGLLIPVFAHHYKQQMEV